jgi:hypothetical protein
LRPRRVVLLADDQPVLLFAVEVRGDECPRSVQLLAVQSDGQASVRLLLQELVGSGVPDLDRSGAVLALRNLALEAGVVEWMILDVDGEVLLAGLERDALRNGPGRERAVALEPEVVVETPRVVPLDDECGRAPGSPARRERLRRPLRFALASVFVELCDALELAR